jgi:hypothetical protein
MNPLLDIGIGGIIQTVGKVADDLFTSDEERLKAELDSFNAETARLQGQTDVNKVEAASLSLFVAGWRPAIGWICGLSLGYVSIFEPIGRFIAQVMYGYNGAFPAIDTTITMQILVGMLGLGLYRTMDKKNGTAS